MNAESKSRTAPSINGHMIVLGAGHSIAFYERNGVRYVAEFRDGGGEFTYAAAWFRLYAGGRRYCHDRRSALQPATPLIPEMLETIERLHRESELREKRMLAALRSIGTAAQRCWIGVMSRLRGRASRISRTVV